MYFFRVDLVFKLCLMRMGIFVMGYMLLRIFNRLVKRKRNLLRLVIGVVFMVNFYLIIKLKLCGMGGLEKS